MWNHRSSAPQEPLPLSQSHPLINLGALGIADRATLLRLLVIFSCFWAAAPKGPMTYAFTQEKFLLLLLLLLLRPPLLKLVF